MALRMENGCQRCGNELPSDSPAYICSYECTYCSRCAKALRCKCPRCGGEMQMRPRREFDANVSRMKEVESRYLEERLQAELKTAQLHLLRDQLTPHFMFNTLHSISTVMARDLPLARRMLVRLSDLLRRTMEAMQKIEVSFREEIEILENYIELQTFRFQGRLRVRYKIGSEMLNYQVPSLLIQPLVENSIRHAIEDANQTKGTVVVSAAREKKNLVIQVKDNGPGLSGHYSPAREGVGLRNTRERLQLLYGPHQRFRLFSRPGEGLAVTIHIPAHFASTAEIKTRQSKAKRQRRTKDPATQKPPKAIRG